MDEAAQKEASAENHQTIPAAGGGTGRSLGWSPEAMGTQRDAVSAGLSPAGRGEPALPPAQPRPWPEPCGCHPAATPLTGDLRKPAMRTMSLTTWRRAGWKKNLGNGMIGPASQSGGVKEIML